ncbi:hypothetical protein C0216_13840 [Streptomyces globosus]|uniref:Secreted protein n=1 Tax=Streptomyces globosus TaxID=68209 RepID=A0A344U0H1_9ACTN|nr:hypothetical protein [Streptomyces globosus]AXE24392.1 hypothetical protein C0216_13840 [Streptomyces globosus]
MDATEPIVFLDVDGPLIPFGASEQELPGGYPAYGPADEGNPLLARLDPALGARLSALPGRLVWATTWSDDANAVVGPRLGMPVLPVVRWEHGGGRSGHWKLPSLLAWAAGRPFVWVDDEIREADRAWVGECHPGPALLHRVDARFGLRDADFARVDAWLRGCR